MWFDELMDDCKRALALVTSNIWISLPYALHALIAFVIIALVTLLSLAFVISAGFGFDMSQDMNWLVFVAGGLGIIGVAALVSSVLNALVEAGSINLFAAVADGAKPSSSLFWSGVRTYFFSMWGMTLFLSLLGFLLSPILIILLALALVAGTLSGGWALLAFSALGGVFLGAWPVALVLDKKGAFPALGAGFRLGKGYFWGMFILVLATVLLSQQLAMAFGPLIAILAGWILAMMVRAWQRMTIILIYKRRRGEV